MARRGLGFALGSGFGLVFGFCASATLEIGGIPAAALEVEARGGQLFGIGFLMTGGAHREQGIAEFLQDLVFVVATAATVGIDGHGCVLKKVIIT